MEETNAKKLDSNLTVEEIQPKWDYTSSRQNLITGAMVVGGNLLVVLVYILYRTVPSVHSFISGKPL